MKGDTTVTVLETLLDSLEATVKQLESELAKIRTALSDHSPTANGPSDYDRLLLDLFTTALEGGINYWSTCSTYHWADPSTGKEDLYGFHADIIETESDVRMPMRIDRDVMHRGYLLAHSASIRWSWGIPPTTTSPLLKDWDFDAGDADCIVQLGLFGQVIYG